MFNLVIAKNHGFVLAMYMWPLVLYPHEPVAVRQHRNAGYTNFIVTTISPPSLSVHVHTMHILGNF